MTNKPIGKKKSHKKLWIILAVVAAVVILLAVLAVRGIQNMADQMTTAMSGNTASVERGTIEVVTEGTGVVETEHAKSEMADYNVKLLKLYKRNGEKAAAGERIAEFDSLVLDETIAALENQLTGIDNQLSNTTRSGRTNVSTPVSGRVKQIFAAEGDSVLSVQQAQGALAEISADGTLQVVFEPQTEVAAGQRVNIVYGEHLIGGSILSADGKTAAAVFEDSDQYDVNAEAEVQTEEGVKLGSGTVVCGHSIFIRAESGYVKRVSVSLNEKVSAGSTLFKLENTAYSQEYLTLLEQREQLAEKINTAREYKKGYSIVAEKDGIVSGLTAKEGDMIPAGAVFCEFLDTGSYQVVLHIDELEIQGIEPEQKVEVTVDALEDKIYTGTVSSVSLAGDNTDGVAAYQVRVLLEEADDLLPGMSANGKITVDQKKDVLLIPVDTIQTVDGEKQVTVVKKDKTTESRKVELGLVNNEKAEVISGLEEGEQLQVIVKLEDIYSQMGIQMGNSER